MSHSSKYLGITSILMGAYLGFLWWKTTSGATFGLIDDGYHLALAQEFSRFGFLSTWKLHLVEVFRGARFYELQHTLLGVLFTVFGGAHPARWYAVLWGFAGLSTLAIAVAITIAMTDSFAGCVAGIIFLSGSFFSEAYRAGLGKAEPLQILGLAFFLLARAVLAKHPRWHFRPAWRLFEGLSLLTATTAKESGVLFALAALAGPTIAFSRSLIFKDRGTRWQWQEAMHRFLSDATPALLAIGIRKTLLTPSASTPYLSHYFSPNLSLQHLREGLHFYALHTPDFLILLGVTAFFMLASVIRRPRGFFSDRALMDAAVWLLTAAAFSGALLTMRFRTVYYIAPAYLAGAYSCGIALATCRRKSFADLWVKRSLWLGILILSCSRFFSVPAAYSTAKAQAAYDRFHWQLVSNVASLPNIRRVYLDVPDDSQLVQEWNFLNAYALNRKDMKVYGMGVRPLTAGYHWYSSAFGNYLRSLNPERPLSWLEMTAVSRMPSAFADLEDDSLICDRKGLALSDTLFSRGAIPADLRGFRASDQLSDDYTILYSSRESGTFVDPRSWNTSALEWEAQCWLLRDTPDRVHAVQAAINEDALQ